MDLHQGGCRVVLGGLEDDGFVPGNSHAGDNDGVFIISSDGQRLVGFVGHSGVGSALDLVGVSVSAESEDGFRGRECV